MKYNLKMKKPLLLLAICMCVVLLFTFSFTGCKQAQEGEQAEESTEAAGTTQEAAEEAETAAAAEEQVTLRIWWWGETEAQGLEPWMVETIALFEEEYPNIKVEATLQSIEQVFAGFQAAVEAGDVPDIQFFFGGIWCLEQAFLGNVQPFSKFFTQEELDQLWPMAKLYTTYKGDVYGFPFYAIGMAGVYNKDLFSQAGLDPDNPPATWDQLVDASEKLKAIGIPLIGAGDKDNYNGGEFMSFWGTQGYDSILDLWKPVVGEEKYTDAKHRLYWDKLDEMVKLGMFNEDITSIDHYQGHELFVRELAATTWTTQPELVRWEQQMGPDKVGVMKFPVIGDGKLADTVGGPVQVLGIPTLAKNPEEAALFFKFMHNADRVKAMYDSAYAIAPTYQFDESFITSEVDKKVLDWMVNKSGPWYQYLYPTQFEAEIVNPYTSLMWTQSMTPDEAVDGSQEFIEKWQNDNPTLVQAFKDWMAAAE